MIVVIDYGMGNLRSVAKALECLDAAVTVTDKPEAVAAADKLVLPGVGAFDAAMHALRRRGLEDPIRTFLASGRPYLGICLGLQLLFERSQEGGKQTGLAILKGQVRRFAAGPLKVPHTGWNEVCTVQPAQTCPLLRGIASGSFFYFVHAYYAQPLDNQLTTLQTDYGIKFTSMVWRDNIYATQFHPEKSQTLGLQLLRNFVEL